MTVETIVKKPPRRRRSDASPPSPAPVVAGVPAPGPAPDPVPIEIVSGLLDVRDKVAHLRTDGYLPGRADVKVPLAQVRQYGLRPGDHVVAAARRPYDRLVEVRAVNGAAPGGPARTSRT
nr:hypothetical protein GCM10020093_079950 [Planobispora longispora]